MSCVMLERHRVLISDKIEQTNPITMCEAVEGTWELCGGIFIDEVFDSMWKGLISRMAGFISLGDHLVPPAIRPELTSSQ